mmetsp:Transcript_28492/g.94559  ORF Transcript_28492/g.94559 Transcript_28492/m.94559 type:complete len:204 (+) Transcript_28492:220-831(+)
MISVALGTFGGIPACGATLTCTRSPTRSTCGRATMPWPKGAKSRSIWARWPRGTASSSACASEAGPRGRSMTRRALCGRWTHREAVSHATFCTSAPATTSTTRASSRTTREYRTSLAAWCILCAGPLIWTSRASESSSSGVARRPFRLRQNWPRRPLMSSCSSGRPRSWSRARDKRAHCSQACTRLRQHSLPRHLVGRMFCLR